MRLQKAKKFTISKVLISSDGSMLYSSYMENNKLTIQTLLSESSPRQCIYSVLTGFQVLKQTTVLGNAC